MTKDEFVVSERKRAFPQPHRKPREEVHGGMCVLSRRVITPRPRLQGRGAGFTTVELLVALTVFAILIAIAAGSFVRVLRTQRAIVSLMEANDNASLVLEQMARELRTGYNFSQVSATEIQFVNAYNFVIWYRLNNGAIERGTEDIFLNRTYKKITADNVKIANFKVELFGQNPGDGYPPRITLGLTVSTTNKYLEGISTNTQTTVSARSIDT